MPPGLIEQLAAGSDDAAAIDYLVESQISFRRALVAAVAAAVPQPSTASRVEEAVQLLVGVDRSAPAGVRAVMRHPYVRAWAAQCLTERAAPDYLACVAAAAAVRGRFAAEIAVPVVDAQVFLPTVGLVRWPAQAGRYADVTSTANGFRIRYGDTIREFASDPADDWYPARRLTIDGIDLVLDDLDPHRDCYPWPVGDRLSALEVTTWDRSTRAAWAIVGRRTSLNTCRSSDVGWRPSHRSSTIRAAGRAAAPLGTLSVPSASPLPPIRPPSPSSSSTNCGIRCSAR